MDSQSQVILSHLIKSQQIASLGTIDNGQPLVSMIAYTAAKDYSEFYMHISGLAKHTKNILEQPKVGLMICEAVRPGEDPQMLARVSINGKARIIAPDSDEYAVTKSEYLKKYNQAEVNFELGDFSMFAINVESARFVGGFGKIFNVTREGLAKASMV